MADKTTESVEDCLKELRQVFGDGPYIRVTQTESITNWNTNGQAERTVLIQIGNWYSTPEPTCGDAMALVRRTWRDRQWHAEQAKETRREQR